MQDRACDVDEEDEREKRLVFFVLAGEGEVGEGGEERELDEDAEEEPEE